MDSLKVGKFIASIRKSRKLTQQEFAKQLCISNKTVSKWEVGAGLPDVGILLPLANNLGITVNELLAGEYLDQNIDKFKADELTLNSIKYTDKQNKKIIKKIILISILVLFVSSLLWYFLTSFNSIQVYQFKAKSEHFEVGEGFFMKSNMENVFQMNDLIYLGEEEIDNEKIMAKLYIDKENDLIIYNGYFNHIYIYEDSKDAKIFTKENIEIMMDNMILELSYDFGNGNIIEEKVKIDFIHKFSNNQLFYYNKYDSQVNYSENIEEYTKIETIKNNLEKNKFKNVNLNEFTRLNEILKEDEKNFYNYIYKDDNINIELSFYLKEIFLIIYDNKDNYLLYKSYEDKVVICNEEKIKQINIDNVKNELVSKTELVLYENYLNVIDLISQS